MASEATSQLAVPSFYQPVVEALGQTKASLLAIVPPQSQLLAESLQHALDSGGKYLRPAVTLLMAGACGGIQPAHVEVAAVSEMIHIATLLHDDVLDAADLRRGRKTVRVNWGNPVSILSGDYLLAQASRKLAQIGNIRLVAIFSDVLADLCDGEVEQIRTSYVIEGLSWEGYHRKNLCKTASLFAAGCEAAAVVNGLPEPQIQALRQFGEHFGVAFQIIDDLLDYTASEATLGKPILDDLRHGLVNAPVLKALESLQGTEREALIEAMTALFDAEDDSAAKPLALKIRDTLQDCGALAETRQLATDSVEHALACLAFLPASPFAEALVALARHSLNRLN